MQKEKYVPLSNRIKESLKKKLNFASVAYDTSITDLLEKFITEGLDKLEKQKIDKND